MVLYCTMPSLKDLGSIQFKFKRKTPNVIGIIIDHIHRIQVTRMRTNGHWTTAVDVNML